MGLGRTLERLRAGSGRNRGGCAVRDVVYLLLFNLGGDRMGLMAQWPYVAYGALVIVGTANREMTGLLLVLSWFALQPRRWRSALMYAALAGLTYATIQYSVGAVESPYTLALVWQENTTPRFLTAAIIYNLLLLPLWAAGVACWRKTSQPLKRLILIVLAVYMPLWAALAIWQETRLLMPLVILFVPLVARPIASAAALK